MDNLALTLEFADTYGEAENRWIRLEQVGRDDSQVITFAEAAALVDDLFGTSPCDNEDDVGTGGGASGEPVDEETFLNRAVDRLRIVPCKKSDGFVDFEVDVLRSHRDGGWNLVGEGLDIGAASVETGRKRESVELEGAVFHDLSWPYYGDLRVSGAVVRDVRGSTVNFARPVTGRVRISYTAIWERVRVRVPSKPDKDGIQRAEPAAVICFWERLAATLDLEQPEDDTDRDTLRNVCPRYRIKNEGDCYETVRHYQRCNCSGAEATGEWSEDVAVPCPDGAAPGDVVGERREFDGYVSCEGEADEFSAPAYYREHCCGEPKGELPRCEVEREENRGDAEIEGGTAKYRAMYGDDVRLTAITPEGGCGEIVRMWRVVDPADATSPPVLPDVLYVSPGATFIVSVAGGRAPEGGWAAASWMVSAGVEGPQGANGNEVAFRTADSFREGTVTVTDACGRVAAAALRVKAAQRWTWERCGPRSGCDGAHTFDCGETSCYPDAPYHFNPGLARAVVSEFPEMFRFSPDDAVLYSGNAPLWGGGALLFSSSETWMIFAHIGCGAKQDDPYLWYLSGVMQSCALCDAVAESSVCDKANCYDEYTVAKIGEIAGQWCKKLVWE